MRLYYWFIIDLLHLLLLIWTCHRFFCCQCLGGMFVSIQTSSLHVPKAFGRIWHAGLLHEFLLLPLLLLPSSLIVFFIFINLLSDLQWNAVMFGVVLLIETWIFWTNCGTVSLTLHVFCLYWNLGLSLKCAHSDFDYLREYQYKFCQQIDTKNETRSAMTLEL